MRTALIRLKAVIATDTVIEVGVGGSGGGGSFFCFFHS